MYLQVMGILAAMTFVRFGLEPLVKLMRRLFVAPGSWEKSSEFYILREVGAFLALVPCLNGIDQAYQAYMGQTTLCAEL